MYWVCLTLVIPFHVSASYLVRHDDLLVRILFLRRPQARVDARGVQLDG